MFLRHRKLGSDVIFRLPSTESRSMVQETLFYFTSSWRFSLLKRLISFVRKVIFEAFAFKHEKKSFTTGQNQIQSVAHLMMVG